MVRGAQCRAACSPLAALALLKHAAEPSLASAGTDCRWLVFVRLTLHLDMRQPVHAAQFLAAASALFLAIVGSDIDLLPDR